MAQGHYADLSSCIFLLKKSSYWAEKAQHILSFSYASNGVLFLFLIVKERKTKKKTIVLSVFGLAVRSL